MRYLFDHDLHIHSQLSLCSGDERQTPAAILDYALANGLHTVCLTDHFWDDNVPGAPEWYAIQNFAHISEAKPLPKADGVRFLFGCETELDMHCTLALSPAMYDAFDFIIIPTTHLHMAGLTCRGDEDAAQRAALWVQRFDAVLDMPLPFHKVGVAHLTCDLMYSQDYEQVLRLIPEGEMRRLFTRAAACGIGIELNFPAAAVDTSADPENLLRPYRIAKECGCKFYFGGDAHYPADLAAEKANAERIIDLLGLTEQDKFRLA